MIQGRKRKNGKREGRNSKGEYEVNGREQYGEKEREYERGVGG